MKYKTEDSRWIHFYPKFSHSFDLEKAGYFDERPELSCSITQLIALTLVWFCPYLIPFIFFGWGKLYIHLPIRTGIQNCESPKWGISFHSNSVFIYTGKGSLDGYSFVSYSLPWDLTWVRTSTLLDTYEWYHETDTNRLVWNGNVSNPNQVTYEWLEENKWKETYPFIDKYDNTVVNATVSVDEREWRPKWFKWTKLFAKTVKSISVEFDAEVGKRKGSWKGGTLGCSYTMLKSETPLDCLNRMQADSKFLN